MNKISDLKPGEERDIIIKTASNVYLVRACGTSGANPYVGEILGKESLDDEYLTEVREEFNYGTNEDREGIDSPAETIRYNRRRGRRSYRSVKERLAAEGYDYLLDEPYEGDTEGDRGQGSGDSHSAEITRSDRSGGSVSNRTLLADAFEELIQSPGERAKIEEYRANIARVEEVQERLKKLRAKIRELTKANGDKAKLAEMNKTAAELADLIDRYDRKLLELEASKPLKDVLARAKTAVSEKREQTDILWVVNFALAPVVNRFKITVN